MFPFLTMQFRNITITEQQCKILAMKHPIASLNLIKARAETCESRTNRIITSILKDLPEDHAAMPGVAGAESYVRPGAKKG